MSSVLSEGGGGGVGAGAPGGPLQLFPAKPIKSPEESKFQFQVRIEYWKQHQKQGYLAQEAKTAYDTSQQLIATLQTQLANAREVSASLSNALARANTEVENATTALAQAQAAQTAVQHFHQVVAPPVESLD